ncbi:MAG: hypothetical protein ACKPKO_30775, partial [Candidatus Fonsibacter sp.]
MVRPFKSTPGEVKPIYCNDDVQISIPPAVFPESRPIYTPADVGTEGFTVPPVTGKSGYFQSLSVTGG